MTSDVRERLQPEKTLILKIDRNWSTNRDNRIIAFRDEGGPWSKLANLFLDSRGWSRGDNDGLDVV